MNLRGEEDKLGFPPRDPIPSKILTEFPPTVGGYRIVCYAFFTALFDTLQEHLSTDHATRNAKTSVTNWASKMCDMSDPPKSNTRADFFVKVSDKYTKVMTSGFANIALV